LKFRPHENEIVSLFLFLTQLLTSRHLKLFITYVVRRNGTMLKTCFWAPKNAKKKSAETLKPSA